MNNKHILFRVDASVRIGTGHVRRCIVIADKLRNIGIDSQFICHDFAGHLKDFIEESGFKCHLMKLPFEEPEKDCLSRNQEQDAIETLNFANDNSKAIFIDNYSLDKKFENKIRENSNMKIIILDDLINRYHNCDLFTDYTPQKKPYDKYINKSARKLLGLEYLILRDEFVKAKKICNRNFDNIENILIFMGGNDPDNVTGFVLDCLSTSKYNHLNVKAIVGRTCPNIDILKRTTTNNNNFELIIQANNMAEMIIWADIAIGSGGVNSWERICLAVPSIIFQLAKNQEQSCKYLSQEKLAEYAGDVSNLDKNIFLNKFEMLINSKNTLQKSFEKQKDLVDAMGAEKLANEINNLIN